MLPGPQQQQQQQQQGGQASLLAAELEGLRAGQLSKLGPYGPGLIDKLMELENAGWLLMLLRLSQDVLPLLMRCGHA